MTGKIKTLRLAVDPNDLDSAESKSVLLKAGSILRAGGTVAFATETVYGLGANALDAAAVRRIFEAKQRPDWDPVITHVANLSQLDGIVTEIPSRARALMDRFWPGPLTLLLPKSDLLPEIITAGRRKAGVRMPSHPVARRLIEVAGVPVAAPSANSFGRTSPTRAQFVLEDLDGRIDAVIDSGESSLGLESTVVDVYEDPPVLYRPGMITLEQLQSVCGEVVCYSALRNREHDSPEPQPSPGIGMKHYAPKARLILFEPVAGTSAAFELAQKLETQGEAVGMMLPQGYEAGDLPRPKFVYSWGNWTERKELARRLFAGLRELDAAGASVILCPLPAGEGIGGAIRDRLLKAAQSG